MTVAEACALVPLNVQEQLGEMARTWKPTEEQLDTIVRLFRRR